MRKRKIPMRKCIASQETYPKKDLIRIVRTPENDVVIDPTGKKSGRGAYLYADLANVDLAEKKKALDRALKVKVDPSIYDELREYVKKRSSHE